MSAAADDHAVFFEALRRSSAKLLRLNPDSLSAAQSVRVDRCAALRLLLDRFQSQQLAGGEIDAKAFIAASASLSGCLAVRLISRRVFYRAGRAAKGCARLSSARYLHRRLTIPARSSARPS
jgi:hypothetical protein